MKRHLKRFMALVVVALLGTGTAFAQDTQTQQQAQTAGDLTAENVSVTDDTLRSTLVELRDLYQNLGQIISQLETEAVARNELDRRVSRLENITRMNTLLQTRAGLMALQPRIEAGEDPEVLAAEIERIRTNLRAGLGVGPVLELGGSPVLEELDRDLLEMTEQLIEGRAEAYEDSYGRFAANIDDAIGQLSAQMQDQQTRAQEQEGADTQPDTQDMNEGTDAQDGDTQNRQDQ